MVREPFANNRAPYFIMCTASWSRHERCGQWHQREDQEAPVGAEEEQKVGWGKIVSLRGCNDVHACGEETLELDVTELDVYAGSLKG